MRWIWLDRITELEFETKCVAIRCVTQAEDVLGDHFAADHEIGKAPRPMMPNPLIIEGMAQTGGILVGHAREFTQKVILAKIGKADFTGVTAGPGTVLRHTAHLERIDDSGASTLGRVDLIDPISGEEQHVADIELMFSHVDKNRAGLMFPEFNFVFSGTVVELLERSGVPIPDTLREQVGALHNT